MATGPMHFMKLHEIHMQSNDFFLNATGPDGKKIVQQMKGILEPVMLYRYVIPKEGLNIVTNTLGDGTRDMPNGLNAQAWAMRKALGLAKIPPLPSYGMGPKLPVSMDHLQIVPLGIKEDVERMMAQTGVVQEGI